MNHRCTYRKNILIGGLFLSLSLSLSQAHDTFLRADKYWIENDDPAFIHVFNGSFNRSISTFDDYRLKRLMISAPDKTTDIPLEKLIQNQTRSKIWKLLQEIDGFFGGVNERYTRTYEFVPESSGSYQAAFELKTNRIAMTKSMHDLYIADEVGANPVDFPFPLENPNDTIIHRYVKTAKLIIQAGDQVTNNVTEPMGLVVEIVPTMNPANVRKGEELEFQLLFNSQPAPNEIALVSDPQNKDAKQRFVSNSEGKFRFPVTDKGPWWIVYIHLEKLDGAEDIAYDNWMTTITFEIK